MPSPPLLPASRDRGHQEQPAEPSPGPGPLVPVGRNADLAHVQRRSALVGRMPALGSYSFRPWSFLPHAAACPQLVPVEKLVAAEDGQGLWAISGSSLRRGRAGTWAPATMQRLGAGFPAPEAELGQGEVFPAAPSPQGPHSLAQGQGCCSGYARLATGWLQGACPPGPHLGSHLSGQRPPRVGGPMAPAEPTGAWLRTWLSAGPG